MPPYSYRTDPSVPEFNDAHPIIVFDGHCVLCSRWAQFIMRRDRQKRLRLLAAQSPLGEALYRHFGLKSEDYDTNLLIDGGRVRTRSDGTLAMFALLWWPWKIMSAFRLIPRPLRDWVYNIIARNRLNWFGRRDICFVPSPETQGWFL